MFFAFKIGQGRFQPNSDTSLNDQFHMYFVYLKIFKKSVFILKEKKKKKK